MTNIVLPKLNQTGPNEWADVQDNDEAIKKVVNGELDTGNLKAAAGITRGQLAAEAKPVTWYTPKANSGEGTRTNTAFGALSDAADEITGVALPTNGLIAISYRALWKETVDGAARAAIFIGANQLKLPRYDDLPVQEARCPGVAGSFVPLGTAFFGLKGNEGTTGGFPGYVTTGQVAAVVGSTQPVDAPDLGPGGGFCLVEAAAGTYNISVQYKASSGSVAAKERILRCLVYGV